jgi:hypothetical protein
VPDYFRFEQFEDVQKLVDAGQQEQIDLEFKSEPWTDRRELAKDISAMANAQGGHILVGVVEAEVPPDGENTGPSKAPKVASDIKPVENPDVEKGRIEQWCAGYTAPRFVPHVYALEREGVSVLVVRVPRSQHAPHMVTDQKEYRYWVRVGARAEIMTDEEIRRAIRRTDHAFVDARSKLTELEGSEHDALAREVQMHIHLVAVPVPPNDRNLDTSRPEVRAILHDEDTIFCCRKEDVMPTLEGLAAPMPGSDLTRVWGEVHRDGSLVWSTCLLGDYMHKKQVCGYSLLQKVDLFLGAVAVAGGLSADAYPYLLACILRDVGGAYFWPFLGDEKIVDSDYGHMPLHGRDAVAIRRELPVGFDRNQALGEIAELLWNAWGRDDVPQPYKHGPPPWRDR